MRSPVKLGLVMMRVRISWMRSNISSSPEYWLSSTPYNFSAFGELPPLWSLGYHQSRWGYASQKELLELSRVLDVYEDKVQIPLPEKFPKPTRVHAHHGEPCPRCETTLEAVFYEDYVMSYCPQCQTEGRVLKDRRLSRLLK